MAISNHQVKKRGKMKRQQKSPLKRSLGWLSGTEGRSFDCFLLVRRLKAASFSFIIKKLLLQSLRQKQVRCRDAARSRCGVRCAFVPR